MFVCTGNICRSPFAEAIGRTHGFCAESCGTKTRGGLPANESAQRYAKDHRIDLSMHRTQRWQDIQKRLQPADLVIATELRHLLFIRKTAKKRGCEVVLMSALLDQFRRVSDPYGKGEREFSLAFGLIIQAVANLKAHCVANKRKRI